MILLPITSLFLAVATIWFIGLSVLTIQIRRKQKVAIGAGNNPELERAMRAQANTAEYLPFMGLMMVVAEVQGLPVWALLALGISILVGRVSHAYGLLVAEPKYKNFNWRIRGMLFTFTPLGLAALVVFLQALGVL
jgi:uncharacterized membrane protein YecN with MAPEG domain